MSMMLCCLSHHTQATKIHEIGTGIALSQGKEAPSLKKRELAVMSSAATFGGMIDSAFTGAQKELAARKPWQVDSMSLEARQREQRELPAELAAFNVAKAMGMDQHQSYLQDARKTFAPGGLTSVVHLPNGGMFDARQLNPSRSTHRVATNGLKKDASKVPHKRSSSSKRKSKAAMYYPMGAPPPAAAATTTTTKTARTFSLTSPFVPGGGEAKSFPAVSFGEEVTKTSTTAAAAMAAGSGVGVGAGGSAIDLTGPSPGKPKSAFKESSSVTTTHTSTINSPNTDMKKRAKKRLIIASRRKEDYVDIENDEVKYKDETEIQKKNRLKMKATLGACAQNPELFDDIVEDAVDREIDDSQQVVKSLVDLMSED